MMRVSKTTKIPEDDQFFRDFCNFIFIFKVEDSKLKLKLLYLLYFARLYLTDIHDLQVHLRCCVLPEHHQ